jgi:hypothetical protein
VKLLLVGESPPRSGEYFYRSWTALFQAVAEALCSGTIPDAASAPEHGAVLSRLTNAGVFLVDLAKCAVNYPGLDGDDREMYALRCADHFMRELEALQPRSIVPAMVRVGCVLRDLLEDTEWYSRLVLWPELPFPNFPDRYDRFVRGLRHIARAQGIPPL